MDIRVRMNQVTVRELSLVYETAHDLQDKQMMARLICGYRQLWHGIADTECTCGGLTMILDLVEVGRGALFEAIKGESDEKEG
jgi:hypothetical protein